MKNVNLIFEKNKTQLMCLADGNQQISIYFRRSLNLNFNSVTMSKGIFINMLEDFINNPNFETHYGTFVSPNADEKDLTNHP